MLNVEDGANVQSTTSRRAPPAADQTISCSSAIVNALACTQDDGQISLAECISSRNRVERCTKQVQHQLYNKLTAVMQREKRK